MYYVSCYVSRIPASFPYVLCIMLCITHHPRVISLCTMYHVMYHAMTHVIPYVLCITHPRVISLCTMYHASPCHFPMYYVSRIPVSFPYVLCITHPRVISLYVSSQIFYIYHRVHIYHYCCIMTYCYYRFGFC